MRNYRWAALHFALPVLLTGLYVVSEITTKPEDGANIGAGFFLYGLGFLGLPWSWSWLGSEAEIELPPYDVIWPAFLNVALHFAIRWALDRRVQR